jgi:hypothetical protein
MIAAITAILGALSGMVPGILQFFTLKASNAQQLALKQLDMQAAKEGAALQIDLANTQSDIQQQQHLYAFAGSPVGIKWVDAVTALVRPYVTLIMFHMWLAIEAALLIDGIRRGTDLAGLAALVWTPATEAIFGAIIGFWFGNRMLMRGQQQMAATLALAPSAKQAAAPRAPAPPATVIPEPPGSRT